MDSFRNNDILEHEANIVKIYSRVVAQFKEEGFSELAKKGENIIKKYLKTKNLRQLENH